MYSPATPMGESSKGEGEALEKSNTRNEKPNGEKNGAGGGATLQQQEDRKPAPNNTPIQPTLETTQNLHKSNLQPIGEVSALRSWFLRLKGDPIEKEKKRVSDTSKSTALMQRRWGTPGTPMFEMVMRYWVSTHMQTHWEYLLANQPNSFKRKLNVGYLEPIPTAWVQDRRLAWPYPEGSTYENPAEKRLVRGPLPPYIHESVSTFACLLRQMHK